MKNLCFALTLAFICIFSAASAQVNSNYHYVNSYYRSNGTFVQGYYRTNPNYTILDNYSTYPNINPHTGQIGTIMPSFYNSYYAIRYW